MSRRRVAITDTRIAKRFVKDLQRAIKQSEYNRGGYAVFLHNEQNEPILQVDIAFPVKDVH